MIMYIVLYRDMCDMNLNSCHNFKLCLNTELYNIILKLYKIIFAYIKDFSEKFLSDSFSFNFDYLKEFLELISLFYYSTIYI